MPTTRAQVHFLPADRSVLRLFRAGISLHSHTEHSREGLQTMPHYLEHLPVVARLYRREAKRFRDRTGLPLDFSRAYWRGPVSARRAYEVEQRQIEDWGLKAIVSLTDHDNIDASNILNSPGKPGPVPISVEWTVPYRGAYFHLGIHNLPPAASAAIVERMAAYTRRPSPRILVRLLRELDADPAILVVINHPLWDMTGLGARKLLVFVREFLRKYAQCVHAAELNGLRPWPENVEVARMARDLGLAVVSGGDRHGFEANAMINLTRAATLAEFVDEIRNRRSSDIAILPQYAEPLLLRQLLTAWDAVREQPQLKNRPLWVNRVYVRCEDGVDRPLSALWTQGAPAWINPCLGVVGILASRMLRTPFRLVYSTTGKLPRWNARRRMRSSAARPVQEFGAASANRERLACRACQADVTTSSSDRPASHSRI